MIDLKLGELYTTRDESLVEAAKGILIDLIEAADWTGFSCEEYLQLVQGRECARLEDSCYGVIAFGKRSYVIAHSSITLAGKQVSSCAQSRSPAFLTETRVASSAEHLPVHAGLYRPCRKSYDHLPVHMGIPTSIFLPTLQAQSRFARKER